MKIFMYDNMCVFVFGTDVKIFSIFSTQTVSEVNRVPRPRLGFFFFLAVHVPVELGL